MPVYTYRCQSCGAKLTQKEAFLDRPPKRCPECHTGILRRVPQLPVIVFKGSGWYSTDHRSPSGQTRTLSQKNDKAEHPAGEKNGS
ncbi:MAG: zinc ribbon domain-containing protein [Chloroflexi bacterium]|nr:zinc ribbon domain-containing protein [Chloroflexota bacterium]